MEPLIAAVSIIAGILALFLIVDSVLTQHQIRENTKIMRLVLSDIEKSIRRTNRRLKEIEILIAPGIDESEIEEDDD